MKRLIISITLLNFLVFAVSCSTAQSRSSKKDAENLKILEQNVESTDSFFNQGRDHLLKNELDKALDSFSKSEYSEAVFYKAVVLTALGKSDEAKVLFEDCAAKNVMKAESNYNLALIAYDSGDAETAKNIMTGVVTLDPKHTGALYFLGNLKYLENDMDGALSYYEKALKIEPGSTDLWEAVFSVRLQKEEFGKAWEIREKLDRSNAETVLNVLKTAELTKNFIEGVKFVPDELKNDRNIDQMTRILLTKGGKFKDAVENGKSQLKQNPEKYVMIDRGVNGDGAYVLGIDADSLFIVCSKDPKKFIKIEISGNRTVIKNSTESTDSSEVSFFAENYCLKK